MCLRVAIYHTCNHQFGWVWRPCDHPLRKSLALPKPRQPHKFIPCGEGINAGLIAFKNPWSEYRADGKACSYCEFKTRRESAVRREEKRASREKLRSEKYLKALAFASERVPRETRGSSTVRQEHEAATHPAFEKKCFKGKAVNGNNWAGRASEDPKVYFPEAELDRRGWNKRTIGERRKGAGSMNTAERGGRREARLGEPATPESSKQKALTEDTTKQDWLGWIFQEQSFAKHKAAREHDAEKRNIEKRLPERVTNISAEPAAVTSEQADVRGRSLQQQTSSESESASPKTETSGFVDNIYTEKKRVKEIGKVEGKMAMKEDKNHQASKDETTKDTTMHERVVSGEATTDANNERVKVHCLCPWQCTNYSGAERRFVGKPRTSSCR